MEMTTREQATRHRTNANCQTGFFLINCQTDVTCMDHHIHLRYFFTGKREKEKGTKSLWRLEWDSL